MGKVEIGIYFCVTADMLKKVLQKCYWGSPLLTIWILSKSLILIGCHGNQNAKFAKKKIISSEAIRGMKLKLCRNVHNISLYKTYVFIAVAQVLSSLWQLKNFQRLIMGKVKVGLYFYFAVDILTKILQTCSLSNPLPNIWILSNLLNKFCKISPELWSFANLGILNLSAGYIRTYLRWRLVAALRSLPVLHHSADFIFWSFGIIELMLVCFEYTVLLKPWLGGVKDVALLSISQQQTH